MEETTMEADGPLYRRWWKVWQYPECCLPCNAVLHPCRASVSQNKTRYEKDGFDLDLTYVTKRIIVHGFPATGVEHIYRNPRTEVQRLLDKYHKEHYKVYNFANEAGRTYPDQVFQGRVERFPFTDHTCPPLESVVNFCENAKAWLDMDEENVVSLHCKAGKGRAGIMAACLLIRLGETALDAVSKYDATRVSDLKGLTVVNQRKWPFMYERLVKEVWGVQDSIGMVPGQDPDLRAPALRSACLREISIQLQPQMVGGKKSCLPNLSCAIYQQEPMGKKLVHRAKMVEVTPREGEPGSVFAVALPRSVIVKGTFQVLASATVGKAIDLWWNTTFLEGEGGDHSFPLSEMDVSPLRLAGRLHQASAKLVVLHTRPHAESPRRRRSLVKSRGAGPLKSRLLAKKSGDSGTTSVSTEVENVQGMDEGGGVVPTPAEAASCDANGEDSRPGPTGASLTRRVAPKKAESGVGDGCEQTEVVSTESISGGDSAGGDVGIGGGPEVVPAEVAEAAAEMSAAVLREEEEEAAGDSSGVPELPAASTEPNADHDEEALESDSSRTLPGPSPAGMLSPVWTFGGRSPHNHPMDPSGQVNEEDEDGAGWARGKMWPSNNTGVSSAGDPSSPPHRHDSSIKMMYAPEDELREGSRQVQRGQTCSRSMDSPGNSFGVTGVPTALSGSMPWGGGGGRGGNVNVNVNHVAPPGRRGVGGKSHAYPAHHRGSTESESDDQLAVGASAFEGGAVGPRGTAATVGPPPSLQCAQWAMEMERAFAQERRRWEEHQHCLETELDWALAARARAEARSEENAARAEVLEGRLDAWRSEYSLIECDIKQAVGLLEMSLSGLVSAETALKKWKKEIPSKAYNDILGCLTKGDTAPGPDTFCEKD